MKKWMSILLILSFTLGLVACEASKSLEAPDDSVFRKDVQDYVSELLDSSATISIFEKTDSEIVGDTLTVICIALYNGTDGENKGVFTLTYSNDGKKWTLEKCRVELEETSVQTETETATSEPATEPPVETVTTEPPVETEPTEPPKPAVSEIPSDYAYVLTEVGTFQDPERALSIQYDALLQIEGKTAKLLSYLGESKNDVVISGIEYMGQGVYVVQAASEEINSVGLISQDGEVLIPCEAAKIDWPSDTYSKSSRYLRVIYTTGETTNMDECFIYTTDSGWSFSGPQEGDTMYTGYALVYDLEARAFVDNVVITNSDSYSMQTCGNNFTVKDESGITKLYNPKGEVLFQTARNINVGAGTFIVSDNGTYRVYDENGNQTYTSNKGLFLLSGNGGYIYKYENDRDVIMDRNGNQVAGAVFEGVYSEMDDVFKVKNNGRYGLVHANGTVILPCDAFADNISYLNFGLYYVGVMNDSGYTYTLIGPNGIIANDLPSGFTYNLKAMDGEQVFVVNDGDYTLTIEDEYPEVPVIGLLAAQSDSNGLYGVFDLFTGEQLLGYEYEVIEAAAGYLYAYKNGAWTVYQIDGPVN